MTHPDAQWRKEASFWDALEVPEDQKNSPHLFTWLESVTPTALEYDFILSTDGSGCANGWGASAAIIQKVDLLPEEENRSIVDSRVLVSATYGSTVQRRELEAFLDGLYEIVNIRAQDVLERVQEEELDSSVRSNPLSLLKADDRATVLWYTDRANLAKSLLFDEWGEVLNARSTERDLWARFSSMARHVCITPMWTPRNKIATQAACDALCSTARRALKEVQEELIASTENIHTRLQWLQTKKQGAQF